VEVILYLDGNEDIDKIIGTWSEVPKYVPGQHVIAPDHDGSLATLVTTCGLIDVIKTQHPKDIPPTYTRGRKRLDYVFVTTKVMESVERSCMLPFHTMFEGDHRPILIDFNARKLFGDPSYEIQRQKTRGLKLQDPRIVNQYLTVLGEQLQYHKIFDKVEDLNDTSEAEEWKPENVQHYEQVDNILTESVRYAERRVAKRYSDTCEWSPVLLRSVNLVRYWVLRLKQSKGVYVDQSTLWKLRGAAKLPLKQSEAMTKRMDIVENLRDARREMRENQKRHLELRRTYLEELADATILMRRAWPLARGGGQ